MSSEMVLKEVRALPFAEQVELCRTLWNDIAQSRELTPGEAGLIDCRLQEHFDHPDNVISWS